MFHYIPLYTHYTTMTVAEIPVKSQFVRVNLPLLLLNSPSNHHQIIIFPGEFAMSVGELLLNPH